jgi:hypothetical protein
MSASIDAGEAYNKIVIDHTIAGGPRVSTIVTIR